VSRTPHLIATPPKGSVDASVDGSVDGSIDGSIDEGSIAATMKDGAACCTSHGSAGAAVATPACSTERVRATGKTASRMGSTALSGGGSFGV